MATSFNSLNQNARRKGLLKHGGASARVDYDGLELVADDLQVDILAINEAISRFAVITARLLIRARVAMFFTFAIVSVSGIFSLHAASPETARFWIAPADSGPIPVALGTEYVVLPLAPSPSQGTVATFDIWAQPARDMNGIYKQLHDLTLNVVSDAPIIDFLDSSIVVANPLLDTDHMPNTPPTKRFSHVRDVSGSVPNESNPAFEMHTKTPAEILADQEADAIVGLQALNLFPTSIPSLAGFGGGCLDDDDTCIQTNDLGPVWRVATFSVSALTEVGDTAIRLQIGSGGIRHAGETSAETFVVFAPPGQEEPDYNAGAGPLGNRGDDPKLGDLPELLISVSDILVGDYNSNGVVDAADYTMWRNRFNTTQPLANRGPVYAGAIGMADYYAWRSNYGRSLLGAASSAVSVPEPGTDLLAALAASVAGVAGVFFGRRRGRIRPLFIVRSKGGFNKFYAFATILSLVGCLSFGNCSTTLGQTYWWDGGAGNSWGTAGNWGIGDNDPTAPNSLSFDSSLIVVFNINGSNGSGSSVVSTLDGQRTVGELRFLSAGTVQINTGSGGPLRIAGGGITTGSVGGGTLTINANTEVTTSQTWDIGRQLIKENPLDLGANTLTVRITNTTLNNESRIDGVISGPGSIIKNGLGELRLAGTNANTFSGYTEVNAGRLVLHKPEGGASNDYGSAVSNLYINGGIVELRQGSQIRDNAVVGMTGGTLDLGGHSERVHSLFMTNASMTGGGNSTWLVNAGAGDFVNTAGTSRIAPTYLTIAGNAAIDVANGELTIESVINDWGTTASFTKTGAGVLALAGSSSNSHTGTVTVNAGTLLLFKPAGGPGDDFGAAVGDLIINNGSFVQLQQNWQIRDAGRVYATGSTLDLGGFSERANLISLNSGHLSGGGNSTWLAGADRGDAIESINDSLISSTYLSLSGNIPVNVVGGTLTVNSTINDWGNPGTLVKQGAGALVLAGNNTFSGGIQLNASTLFADYLSLGTGNLNIDGGWFAITSDESGISNNIIVGAGGAAIDTQGRNPTFFGTVSGGGALNKVSGGTLYLAGNNSGYTGGTRILAGGLMVQNVNALAGSTLNLASADGGVLQFHPSISSATIGGLTGSRDLSLQTTDAAPIVLSVGNNNTSQSYSGALMGSGSLIKTGSGTLTLNGGSVNTHSSGTIVNQGTLVLARVNDQPTREANDGGTVLGNLTINSGGTVRVAEYAQIKDTATVTINNGGTLELFGTYIDGVQNLVLNDGLVSGSGGIAIRPGGMISSSGQSTISTPRVIPQFTVGDFEVNVANGVLSIPSGIEGTSVNQKLRKEGAGKLVLGGTSFHDLGSVIDAGTLAVNGTHVNSVVVNSGGTLAGNGTIGGSVTGPGRVAPGNSPGILTVNGDYTQTASSVLAIEIGGLTPGNMSNNHDQVLVGGTATLAGTIQFSSFNGFTPSIGDEITFLTASAVVGAPDAVHYSDLQSIDPDLGFRVFKNATDVRLRYVEKSDIVFVDNTGGMVDPEDWNEPLNWVESMMNHVPFESDVVSLNGSQTGAVQRVDVKFANGTSHAITVEDSLSSITLGVSGGKTLSATVGGVRVGANATLELDTGTLSSAQAIEVYDGGMLAGNGSVQGSVEVGMATGSSGGMLSPGMSTPGMEVGSIEIGGNYTQGAGGEFEVDLQGKNMGQFDTVNVTSGTVLLGGTLRVDVSELSSVAVGDMYTLITAPSGSGEFDEFELVDPSETTAGLYFSQFSGMGASATGTDTSYSAGGTWLIKGDANGRGGVDQDDAQAFASAILDFRDGYTFPANELFGETRVSPVNLRNCFNFTAGTLFDTAIDVDDISGFLAAYSESNGVGMSQASDVFGAALARVEARLSVPEPNALYIACFAVGWLVSARRRHMA